MENKMSLIAWNKICQPLGREVLGIRKMQHNNEAFIMKLGFNLMAKADFFWVSILREKYKKLMSVPLLYSNLLRHLLGDQFQRCGARFMTI